MTNLVGDTLAALFVKGAAWDIGTIEPAGPPALKLGSLLRSRTLEKISNEDMATLKRANLVNPGASTPSSETLLHTFSPHKFFDHTHSTAIFPLNGPSARYRVTEPKR